MDYLVTLNKVTDLLWFPLTRVVWRDIRGTAFTTFLPLSTEVSQNSIHLYVMQSHIIYSLLNKTSDRDPLNWFHGALMVATCSCVFQTRKHYNKAPSRRNLFNKRMFLFLIHIAEKNHSGYVCDFVFRVSCRRKQYTYIQIAYMLDVC